MSDQIPEVTSQGEQNSNVSEISESPELTYSESTASAEQETQQESKINPNWKEALDALPDEFTRNKVIPVFDKWDKNNNSRFEKVQQELSKYDPYKPLIENNVSFEEVQLAWQLREQIANDPKVVFERLAGYLGFDVSQLLNGEQSQGLEEINPEEPVDPRMLEIQRTQEAQNAYLAQIHAERQAIEQEKQEQLFFNETKTELDRLSETYGNFDRNRVVQEALWIADKTGKPIDLEAGVKSLRAYEDQIRQSTANNKAPQVFGGGGGLPSGAVDTSKMSDDEVIAYAAARAKALNGG